MLVPVDDHQHSVGAKTSLASENREAGVSELAEDECFRNPAGANRAAALATKGKFAAPGVLAADPHCKQAAAGT